MCNLKNNTNECIYINSDREKLVITKGKREEEGTNWWNGINKLLYIK